MGICDGVRPHELVGGVGEKSGDFFLLGIARHADDKLPEGVVAHSPSEGRQGIDRKTILPGSQQS